MTAKHAALLTGLVAAAAAVLYGAYEEPLRLPSASVHSVFHIEKSENRNQVHYAVDVDDACRPLGKTPVRGYWRDFEEGPRVVSRLLDREQAAYGLTAPRAIERDQHGGNVRIAMRALPDRPVRITTFREGERCRARAYTPIQGQPAVLKSIYVEIGFLSIDHMILRGIRVADGADVHERIED